MVSRMQASEYLSSRKHIAHCKRIGRARRIKFDLKWFMGKVKKMPSGCWEWQGSKTIHGYGFFQISRSVDKVRRVVARWKAGRYHWKLRRGDIPKGKWLLHHCDNPNCVRLSHLYLGTIKDNTRDIVKRDRGYYKSGERHPRATITNETAKRIIDLLHEGKGSTDIARTLNLKLYTVENIKYGNSFQWLR